jgi:hypothetical protein
MMLTREPSTPDFDTPVEIEPAGLNDFCRRFELVKVNLSEIEPISQQERSGHKLVGIRIGCDAFHTSPRFIKSLMLMFCFTDNIFNYFSPAELFARIIDRHQGKTVQLCFDQKDKAVMAATQSDNQLFPLAKVIDAVQQNEKLLRARYRPKNGVLETFIEQPNQWQSKADSAYQGRFRFTTPIDCWGDSKIALGLVREVCSNGAVVTKDIFTSKVIVEKENGTHLRQLLETFRNDRAFATMQKRLNDARYIKVSAAEYFKATQLFILHGGEHALKIVERLEDFANYPEQFYQCESFDKIAPARRKDLPVDLSLLNLLNMVSEVMTHRQKEDESELENFYTTLMTKPSDLEGIYTTRQPVRDLFFNDLRKSA